MRILNIVCLALVIIGGLNWGLIGLFNFNLVAAIFGVGTIMTNIIYLLVGLAAIYCLYFFKLVSEHPRYEGTREVRT